MSDDETDLEPQFLAPAREVEDSVVDACDCCYTQTNPDQGHSMKVQVLALLPPPAMMTAWSYDLG